MSSSRADKPVFGKLEKPRVGQRDRVPTADETSAILSQASPEFREVWERHEVLQPDNRSKRFLNPPKVNCLPSKTYEIPPSLHNRRHPWPGLQ